MVIGGPGQWTDVERWEWSWQRCTASSVCTPIPGQTAEQYLLTSADAGFLIRADLKAINVVGSTLVTLRTTVVAAGLEKPTALNVAIRTQGGVAPSSRDWVVGSAFRGTSLWAQLPTSLAYSWQRCASSCVPVAGQNTDSYVVTNADVNFRLRLDVTATNAAGSTTASSTISPMIAAGTIPPPPAPVPGPAALQSQLREFRVGSEISGDRGTWQPLPTISFGWQRCPATSDACVAISGQTANRYMPTLADVGARVRLVVTGTNVAGSTIAYSPISPVILPAIGEAPRLVESELFIRPISGNGTSPGSILRAVGTWTGSPTFAYQWQSCADQGLKCLDIAGQTSSDHTITSTDRNRTLRVVVTASNSSGATTVTSAASPLIP